MGVSVAAGSQSIAAVHDPPTHRCTEELTTDRTQSRLQSECIAVEIKARSHDIIDVS